MLTVIGLAIANPILAAMDYPTAGHVCLAVALGILIWLTIKYNS